MFRKIILRLGVIGGLVAIVSVAVSGAFFQDFASSQANITAAGPLDLLVNGQNDPQTVVEISDLKPSIAQFANKTMEVDNPAKIFLHLKDFVSTQGLSTEPEEVEELGSGIKHDIETVTDYDLTIGETPIISLTDAVSLTDAASCWIPLGQIPASSPVPMTQSFHLQAGVTNWAQGDTVTFTEDFLAQQLSDPVLPDTGSGRVWNPVLKNCVVGQMAPLYDSSPFTCATGATSTGGPIFGTVTSTSDGVNVSVFVSLVGATPNSSYDIWINQDPGGCPLAVPTEAGAILTDGSGNGIGDAVKPVTPGATKVWISAVGGGQVLRSLAVSL